PFALPVVERGEAALHEPAERFHGGGGGDALGRPSDADAHVDGRAEAGSVDPAGDVTVEHEPGACPGLADRGDEFGVTGAVEYGDGERADVFAFGFGEGAQVVADGAFEVDDAVPVLVGDDFVHVEDAGGVEHGAGVA